MLEFKNIEISDIDNFKKIASNSDNFSCDNNFINLLIWQCKYNNSIAFCDGQLIVKSGYGKRSVFMLPLGDDFIKGMSLITEYCAEKKPCFWAQEGSEFEKFKLGYAQDYKITPLRDAFDYLYLREDLAELKGKKYHSKRNHISTFSKKYDWHYEKITEQNLDKIIECAELWYEENSYRMDDSLLCEKQGVTTILENFDKLDVLGGAIFVGEKAVAFTLGSPINSQVFDIHIEKALKDYMEAYTVINREFAQNDLIDFEYINREDDMGIEGLRKAKLSYNPKKLIEKYYCIAEEDNG